MKKETTVVLNIEATKIYKNGEDIPTAKELEAIFREPLDEAFDDVHLNVQVFELEKEERISTEDLIKSVRACTHQGECADCVLYDKSIRLCSEALLEMLADRLEELHNQQKATQTKPTFDCDDCKHRNKVIWAEPCKQCNGNYDKWERA